LHGFVCPIGIADNYTEALIDNVLNPASNNIVQSIDLA